MEKKIPPQKINDELDANILLDKWLEKYGLIEDNKKVFEKIKEGIKPNKAISGKLVKALAENSVNEQDALNSLMKSFSVTIEVAKNMLSDLKPIIPAMKEITESQKTQEKKAIENQKKEVSGLPPKIENIPLKSTREVSKPVFEKKTFSPDSSFKADSYREPIE